MVLQSKQGEGKYIAPHRPSRGLFAKQTPQISRVLPILDVPVVLRGRCYFLVAKTLEMTSVSFRPGQEEIANLEKR